MATRAELIREAVLRVVEGKRCTSTEIAAGVLAELRDSMPELNRSLVSAAIGQLVTKGFLCKYGVLGSNAEYQIPSFDLNDLSPFKCKVAELRALYDVSPAEAAALYALEHGACDAVAITSFLRRPKVGYRYPTRIHIILHALHLLTKRGLIQSVGSYAGYPIYKLADVKPA